MSALPQRKKSAEEIAKLREEMGLPPAFPTAPADAPPAAEAGTDAISPTRHSPAPLPETADEEEVTRPKSAAKPVRSLKRSERKPAPESSRPAPSGKESNLPTRRRSASEMEAIRQRDAAQIQMQQFGPPAVVPHMRQMTAHPVLLTLGYGLALAWGVGGLLVAAYIAVKKPCSRHHAGFMTAIAVLVLVYLALHYFPNLNPVHAS